MLESTHLPTVFCRICSSPTTSAHFGIDACRACSSFFKRTVLARKEYNCRRGDGKCYINKDISSVCKRCRYEKCIATGMTYTGPMRSDSGKKSAESVESTESSSMEEASPSTSSPPEPHPVPREYPILDRVGTAYKASIERRRLMEWAELTRNGTIAHRTIPHPTEVLFFADNDTMMRTLRITTEESWAFFRKAFPLLEKLSCIDQTEMHRSFLCKYTMMDAALRTMEVWGAFGRYSMCAVSMCADLDDMESWLPQGEGGENRQTLLETIRSYITEQQNLLAPSITSAALTEQEKYALYALIALDAEFKPDAAEAVISLVEDMRAQTLSELQRYYREEMRLADCSVRLGAVLTLCHLIKESTMVFAEYFRMQVAIFDLYAAQTYLKELIL